MPQHRSTVIYIHVPFCISRCSYCGFYSELLPRRRGSDCVSPRHKALTDAYVDALVREIGNCNIPCGGVNTLYLGGGTPSVLEADRIGRIVMAAKDFAGTEFSEQTIEVNPDDIVTKGPGYASDLRKLGFNRISMGVQSLDNEVLRKMGRRHDAAEAIRAISILRDAGFDNISVDFIFGFSRRTPPLRDWIEQLGSPEHVSCYQLSIEEGSALEKMIDRGIFEIPEDEQCADQYNEICSVLHEAGYEHYEISNWARKTRSNEPESPFRSMHNSAYWHHVPYLGFGPGAHSLAIYETPKGSRFVRSWNEPDLKAYLSGPSAESETLSPKQIAEEKIMLGLRTAEGVDSGCIRSEAGKAALAAGLLEHTGGNLRIPESKWFISDTIITLLI